jgi:hypothetical protein
MGIRSIYMFELRNKFIFDHATIGFIWVWWSKIQGLYSYKWCKIFILWVWWAKSNPSFLLGKKLDRAPPKLNMEAAIALPDMHWFNCGSQINTSNHVSPHSPWMVFLTVLTLFLVRWLFSGRNIFARDPPVSCNFPSFLSQNQEKVLHIP